MQLAPNLCSLVGFFFVFFAGYLQGRESKKGKVNGGLLQLTTAKNLCPKNEAGDDRALLHT